MTTDLLGLRQELRPTTIISLGGLIVCSLFVMQDPVVRVNFLLLAKDRRVRRGVLDAVKRVGREMTVELEGWC